MTHPFSTDKYAAIARTSYGPWKIIAMDHSTYWVRARVERFLAEHGGDKQGEFANLTPDDVRVIRVRIEEIPDEIEMVPPPPQLEMFA